MRIRADGDRAFALAASVHAGPVFWDIPIDVIFAPAPREERPAVPVERGGDPDPDELARARALLAEARHPLLILSSGVWMGDAVDAARSLVADRNLPVIANGMGRGVIPPSDPHLVTRARSAAFKEADLVIVVGTPLDFRLGYGSFGDPPAKVVHVIDARDRAVVGRHRRLHPRRRHQRQSRGPGGGAGGGPRVGVDSAECCAGGDQRR